MHAKERASTSHNERRVVDNYIKLSSNAGRKLKGRFHSRPRSDARDTHRRPNGKALKQKMSSNRWTRLFYVAGIIPPERGPKQLSQRGNAELFFRSSAISLNRFQTQIQIASNF